MRNRSKVVCVLNNGDHYLLTVRVDPVKRLTFLIPVGGGVEPGESPEEAVHREVHEELGIGLADAQFLGTLVNTLQWKGEWRRETVHCYAAPVLPQEVPSIGTEYDGQPLPLVWRTLQELREGSLPLFPDGLIDLLNRES